MGPLMTQHKISRCDMLNIPALCEVIPQRSPCTIAAIRPASWTGRHLLYHDELQRPCRFGLGAPVKLFLVCRQPSPQPLLSQVGMSQVGVVLRR